MAGWDLARDGFTVLHGFLEREEIQPLCAEIERVLAEPLPAGCERPHNTLAPLAWGDPPIDRVLARRERRERLRAALLARDLRWISGYVSVKQPHSEPLDWHQDWWCWDHPVSFLPAAAQVAVMVYVSDTSPATAALRVRPGSHQGDTTREPVTLATSAGDAVACDYRLLHGTHANRADVPRNCLILNFAPSWSSLPDEIRAHLIRHPALTREAEDELLPRYAGRPRDLPLSRSIPAAAWS